MPPCPFVTIAVPLLNEATRLPGLLTAILAQDYPVDRLQVLLVDGGSRDETRQLALEAAAEYPFITVLDNAGVLAAAALNLALTDAEGEILLRLDARTRPAPDYVCACVRALQTGAANGLLTGVGGPQVAAGDTPPARIQALALNHPFGVGGPVYRRASKPVFSETIYLGAYPVNWLHRVGGWDDVFARNEDYELNVRLREAGGQLLVDPSIHSSYLVRGSLWQLAEQYFHYGVWRTVTLRRHPLAWRWRHLAPALLVAALAGALFLVAWTPWPLTGLLAAYLGLDLAVSLQLSLRHGLAALPRLLVVFPLLHLSWGIGFWLGLIHPPAR